MMKHSGERMSSRLIPPKVLAVSSHTRITSSGLITLRSDFLGETQDHQRLNSLIAERGFIVPAMTVDETAAALDVGGVVEGG